MASERNFVTSGRASYAVHVFDQGLHTRNLRFCLLPSEVDGWRAGMFRVGGLEIDWRPRLGGGTFRHLLFRTRWFYVAASRGYLALRLVPDLRTVVCVQTERNRHQFTRGGGLRTSGPVRWASG